MDRNQPPWPCRWLMTDERLGGRLWDAIGRLPPAAGIVFRHYSLHDEARAALARQVAAAANARGLVLAIAGNRKLADELGAALVHNPDQPGGLPFSMAAHDDAEATLARGRGAALVFLGPIFPTRSHPGTSGLGMDRAAELARLAACPAIAIGGMDEARFAQLEAAHPGAFHGYAGIDCWVK